MLRVRMGDPNMSPKGLDEALQRIQLGSEGMINITGTDGYGAEGHQGNIKAVPPNADLLLQDVAVMKIKRGDTLHARKQPSDNEGCLMKCLYTLFRAY